MTPPSKDKVKNQVNYSKNGLLVSHPPTLVGIGASAGGIQSLNTFFDNTDSALGFGYVVIVHLSSDQESNLPEILAKHTKMPVVSAKKGTAPLPNHVYVISPNTILRISHGKFDIEPLGKPHHYPVVVDEFFSSLAKEKRETAIGIILSGTGNDGSQGIKQIHEEGGLCFAENTESAQYNEMPESAISTGCVDFVAPVKTLAKNLSQIGPKFVASQSTPQTNPKQTTLKRIFSILETRTGVLFEHYKQTTIIRRLNRRIILRKFASAESYFAYLRNHTEEQDALYQDLLISVTEFFRDEKGFETLTQSVFADLVERLDSQAPIRVWVPGCSTGEEAYSIAIAWLEYTKEKGIDDRIQIFATDVNEKVIDKARAGIYDKTIENKVSKKRLHDFFTKTNNSYCIKKQVRDLCVFAIHDLIKDPPFSQLDLISCRNTLIYFATPLQKKLISSFHYSLKPMGYLCLGESESIGNSTEMFDLKSKSGKIYQKKTHANFSKYSHLFDFNFSPTPHVSRVHTIHGHIVDEDKVKRQAEKLILDSLGPAGWIANKDMQVIHILGKTGPYMSPQTGTPDNHLFKMICSELHTPIRMAIEEVKKRKSMVIKDGISIKQNSETNLIHLEIRALHSESPENPYFLITLNKVSPISTQSENRTSKNTGSKAINNVEILAENQQLHQELGDVRYQMQSALESQEAGNEELRAANEELQSSNEELRSTNEELQTAKEELQSSNEELATVNDELQNRNDDLNLLSDDLENFIQSTMFPVIMLDRKLRIRRFTPAAKELFSLIPTDTARPLSDMKENFDLPELSELISSVVESLQIVDRDIKTQNNKWYSLKIRPYKNGENKIAGAILTFSDITVRKKLELVTQESRDLFQSIVETVREPMLVLDSTLSVILANRGYYTFFKTSKEETVGIKIWSLGNGQWGTPDLKQLLCDILPKNNSFDNFEVTHQFEKIGKKTLLLNARHINHQNLVLIAFEEIKNRKSNE